MAGRSVSTLRAIAIATLIILLTIIVVGIGLGVGIKWTIEQQNKKFCSKNGSTKPKTTRPTLSIDGRYRYGAVAADAGECSTVGTDIMAKGGSAVDVAIAGALCSCVYNLHNCGIGGGHFMTVYKQSEKKAYAIIAREMAPGAAHQTMFVGRSSQDGGLAIAIPGEVRGFWQAHQIAGKLPWKQLFEPIITICKKGFKVRRALANQIKAKMNFFDRFPNFEKLVTDARTGKILREGDTIQLPKLAKTLEIISEEGPDAFYNGSLTQDIVDDIQEAGGIITREDLSMYNVAVKDVLVVQLHDGLQVLAPPPPSSGAVYLFILGILDGYKFDSRSISTTKKSIETWHRIVEAFKFAYAKRTMVGDSDAEGEQFRKELNMLIANLTSSEFTDNIRSQITDNTTHRTEYYGPLFQSVDDAGTSHLSVLSPNGDAVSITTTYNTYFGSKVVGSRTGIIFNNEMDDFSTPNTVNYFGVPASPANFIKPYKRPLSSMCPGIVIDKNGDVRLVVGASGGTKITTVQALVTMETLWFGMTTKQAIDYKRLHHQLLPETIAVEKGFSEEIIKGLKMKGHKIAFRNKAGSVVQAILQNPGEKIDACSDYRKQSYPDGL